MPLEKFWLEFKFILFYFYFIINAKCIYVFYIFVLIADLSVSYFQQYALFHSIYSS